MANPVAAPRVALLNGTTNSVPINLTTAQMPIQYNLLVVSAYVNADQALHITDSGAGTWTSAVGGDIRYPTGTPNRRMNIWYKQALGTETSVTVTSTGAITVHYYEWANVSATVDQFNYGAPASGTPTSQTTNSITTTNPYDLVYVVASSGGAQNTESWGGYGTNLQGETTSQLWDAYTTTTTTTTTSATTTYGTATPAAAAIVAFPSFNRTTAFVANAPVTTDTYTAGGATFYWAPPSGVTVATVYLWGGGGGGASFSAGGGGGGQFAQTVVPVTSNTAVLPNTPNVATIVVGAGGAGGAGNQLTGQAGGNGNSSTFNSTTVVANGGTGAPTNTSGGAGGTGGTGSTLNNGGAGGTGDGGQAGYGGGGGGSGGTAIGGNAGGNAVLATSAGAGAMAVTNGGPGGNGATPDNGGSKPVSGPGGGGGGGSSSLRAHGFYYGDAGGAGYNGQVIIKYPSNSGNFFPFFIQ